MSAAPLRLGFDEAGLGPTLGPLVVAGFGTRRAGAAANDTGPIDDLLGPLAAVVGRPGVRDGRLEVGDSKKIHTGKRKLERIERTALATVGWVHGRIPASAAELLALVGVDTFVRAGDRRAPWWTALDETLPVASERSVLEDLAAALSDAASAAGVRSAWYRADVVGAARVNRELAAESTQAGGSKNTWATHAVLRLAALALAETGADRETTVIWCDKAGGRQAYVEPLRRAFPELPEAHAPDPDVGWLFDEPGALEIVGERRERSHYRLALDGRRVELGFVMGGDRLDPRISWASILAKYLRELVLRAFNRYFSERISSLRPTAGYPEDARRFIAEVEAELGPNGGLRRDMWVRSK